MLECQCPNHVCSRGQTHPAQHKERTGNKARVLDDREFSLLEKETKGTDSLAEIQGAEKGSTSQ